MEFARIIVATIGYGIMIILALGSLAVIWRKWIRDIRTLQLPMWRQIGATFGLVAVTGQSLLFVTFWILALWRDYSWFGWWARAELLLFAIGLPLVFLARGASRWWGLSACVVLFTLSLLTMSLP